MEGEIVEMGVVGMAIFYLFFLFVGFQINLVVIPH